MKYMDFIMTGPIYRPIVKQIKVKYLGLPKVVVVRTRANGGI